MALQTPQVNIQIDQKDDDAMWAQIIKVRVKPGREDDLRSILEQIHAAEQAESGLLRSSMMRDQKDPQVLYMMIVVESEEKARVRERDPRREELHDLQAKMADTLEGPPEFIDLEVINEIAF
ncbi:MAG: putative quinol monooxygenase [Chloroflexota bacterium]